MLKCNILTCVQVMMGVLSYLLVKTPWQGSQTVLNCAVSKELEGVSGRIYANCKEKKLESAVASDDEVAEKLWKVSAEMVGI